MATFSPGQLEFFANTAPLVRHIITRAQHRQSALYSTIHIASNASLSRSSATSLNMAHRQGVGQGEPSQDGHWPAASNDHYCPSETACRHAVIDISSADTVPSEASEEHQRLRQLSRANDRYYPEGTDYHAFGRRRRSASYDYTNPSPSGHVPSQEEDNGVENLPWKKPSRSRSASPTR
jgi:hypothetical protein